MEIQSFIEGQIEINAPAAKVWDALVNPALTPKYMHNCKVVSNWNIGDPVLWKGANDDVIYVKGNLIELDTEKTLSFSVIDPNATYVHSSENHLVVTYNLSVVGNSTILKVKQGNFKTVADGAKRYEDMAKYDGWTPVLEMIKNLVEN